MKLSKGIVKNINKKLISGTLALTLLMTPLSGCSEEYADFEYSVNEQGKYEVSGNIGYELLKDYYFLVIENSSYNTTEFYIGYEYYHNYRGSTVYYTYDNIFNNQEVFNEKDAGNRKIVFLDKVESYLLAYNEVKANYTKEDVEQLLEQMKENYLKQNNKQLVKE